jgi:hypothetical protein
MKRGTYSVLARSKEPDASRRYDSVSALPGICDGGSMLRPYRSRPKGAFRTAPRKGRERQGATGRVLDVTAGGEPATRNTKTKAVPTIQELITKADIRAVSVICATACLSLFLLEFAGNEGTYAHLYPPNRIGADTHWVLRTKAWWVLWIVISFVVIPVIAMMSLPGKRMRDCNLSFRGFAQHFWIYLGLLVAVLPVIWAVSLTPEAASVVAGFVLGYLAWKLKSIWGGVCVHCAVAVSMDLLALSHKNQLPWMHR